MKRFLTFAAVGAALAVPVAAAADQPTSTDKQNAAKQCKSFLKAEGTSNFTHAWGAHGKGRAYGKCVSSTAKKLAQQRQEAQSNAAKQCKTEQAQTDDDFKASHDGKTFADFYGAQNAKSAYGKCVSTNAKKNREENAQLNKDQLNAAKWCRGQQTADKTTFNQTYRNFGACVSKRAHDVNAQRQQQQQQTQNTGTTQQS